MLANTRAQRPDHETLAMLEDRLEYLEVATSADLVAATRAFEGPLPGSILQSLHDVQSDLGGVLHASPDIAEFLQLYTTCQDALAPETAAPGTPDEGLDRAVKREILLAAEGSEGLNQLVEALRQIGLLRRHVDIPALQHLDTYIGQLAQRRVEIVRLTHQRRQRQAQADALLLQHQQYSHLLSEWFLAFHDAVSELEAAVARKNPVGPT
ncbi:hypothetical protein CXG81DRAFT_26290 [Caulochytrium protostelioides]|uniref:Uncharacterized protein n=1 Tax=Caulochytrium protostelioides TaxID=1555241 RepID=A0A4P9X754_9FUNG|nr:hypothetical protein CXG81DRAFT_26290 [Caulochytrium protostelioides]|eukprot:RKP01038.1 hypothetical protein CXG81DRAFT_26290 [Caulochytrium protostelioides]